MMASSAGTRTTCEVLRPEDSEYDMLQTSKKSTTLHQIRKLSVRPLMWCSRMKKSEPIPCIVSMVKFPPRYCAYALHTGSPKPYLKKAKSQSATSNHDNRHQIIHTKLVLHHQHTTILIAIFQITIVRNGHRGWICTEKNYVTLDCFCGQPIIMLVNSMQGNPDIRAARNGACRCVEKSQCHPPQKCPFPWGSGSPSNTQFRQPSQLHNPNGILIGSAIFAGITVITGRETNRQKDRQTDHTTPCIAIGCMQATSVAMRSNNRTYTVHNVKEILTGGTGRWTDKQIVRVAKTGAAVFMQVTQLFLEGCEVLLIDCMSWIPFLMLN